MLLVLQVEETDASLRPDPQDSEFCVDEDAEVIRKRYLSDVGGGSKQMEVAESWREIRWTWRQLPGMYLQLSKSRLTGELWCLR